VPVQSWTGKSAVLLMESALTSHGSSKSKKPSDGRGISDYQTPCSHSETPKSLDSSARKGFYYDKPNTSVTVKIKMILKLKLKVKQSKYNFKSTSMSKLTNCHLTGSKSIELCITQLNSHYVITIMIYLSKFIKTKG